MLVTKEQKRCDYLVTLVTLSRDAVEAMPAFEVLLFP
jgi:hypothetical protein